MHVLVIDWRNPADVPTTGEDTYLDQLVSGWVATHQVTVLGKHCADRPRDAVVSGYRVLRAAAGEDLHSMARTWWVRHGRVHYDMVLTVGVPDAPASAVPGQHHHEHERVAATA